MSSTAPRRHASLRREMGERELISRIQDIGISRPGAHLLRLQQQRRQRRRRRFQQQQADAVQPVDLTGMEGTLRECIHEFGEDPEEGYIAAAAKILKNPLGRYTAKRKKELRDLAKKCDKVHFTAGKIGGRRRKRHTRRRRRRRRRRRGGFGPSAAGRTALLPVSLYYLQKRMQRKSRRKRYRKGSPSKTRKGRQDFITHLGSTVFDRLGHWFRGTRKPYTRRRRTKHKK